MASDDADRVLIDSMMPQYDAMIAEHLVVAPTRRRFFRAAQTLDFLTVSSPLLTMSM